jgi:hypothetical protein
MKKNVWSKIGMVLLCIMSLFIVSCHKETPTSSNENNTPPPTPINVNAEYSSIYGYVHLTWDIPNSVPNYKIYRSSSANGYYENIEDNWYSSYYYDYSPLDGPNYYKVQAYNQYGESGMSSYAYCSTNSNPNPNPNSNTATDHQGHDLSSWTLTSAGNYRKTFTASYHVSGNYQAYPSNTDWTHTVTVEYKPKVKKYWLYEPYFNPTSNQGLGLGYDDDINWGYNSVEVHTYTYYDYTYHVLYEAVCFCRFTIN